MDLNQTRATILALPLIEDLPESMRLRGIMLILGVGEAITTENGEVLIQEGSPDMDDAYALLDGAVSIEIEGRNGMIVGAPDILGELIHFNPVPRRAATVRAIGEAELIHFAWSTFQLTAKSIFKESEMDSLRQAIEATAWRHFGA